MSSFRRSKPSIETSRSATAGIPSEQELPTSEASSTAPTDAQTPPEGDMSDLKVAGRIQDRVDQAIDEMNRRDGLI